MVGLLDRCDADEQRRAEQENAAALRETNAPWYIRYARYWKRRGSRDNSKRTPIGVEQHQRRPKQARLSPIGDDGRRRWHEVPWPAGLAVFSR